MDLGIHHSIEQVFPPTKLSDAVDGVANARIVESETELTGLDGLVTFSYESWFLDADLSWIHSVQAGVDRFPYEELDARGIRLTNSTGIHGDAVGETVVGYMTSLARRLHAYRSRQERTEWAWPEWDEPFTLNGERITVVGLGTLGRGVAARADALGMDVTGVRRTPTPVDHVQTVFTPARLEDAIADARFVVVTVPLTEDTRGLVGESELAAMRDDAYLVNVARGAVVDQDALVTALQNDRLAGAALDVFEEEPLPDDSPLWEMDEVIVTPHAAAATRDYYERIATLVRENCRRLENGDGLVNAVL